MSPSMEKERVDHQVLNSVLSGTESDRDTLAEYQIRLAAFFCISVPERLERGVGKYPEKLWVRIPNYFCLSAYDEMVKQAVALKLGTATAEAILKRFNSYNVTHPTYKALAELGKVEKTIYLCEYLSSLTLRHEVEEGLNVVERWNAANDFLCYGRQGIWATNSREQQEVTTLALQLLQNCLML